MNKSWWWLAAFIVVGILLGIGVLLLISRPPRGEPVTLLRAPTPAPITVYVSGSVSQPGLYSLAIGSRVKDAIQAAGGFSTEADSTAINLADILEDGQQVNIPSLVPTAINESSTRSTSGTASLVNINTASLEELDSLPEIGPVTAQRILDYRTTKGLFNTIEDLLEVDGIGQITFDKIKDLITVGTSP